MSWSRRRSPFDRLAVVLIFLDKRRQILHHLFVNEKREKFVNKKSVKIEMRDARRSKNVLTFQKTRKGYLYTYDSFYRNVSCVDFSGEFSHSLIRIFVSMRIDVTPCTSATSTSRTRGSNSHCRCEQRRGHCNVTKTEFIILTRGPVC